MHELHGNVEVYTLTLDERYPEASFYYVEFCEAQQINLPKYYG